MTAVAALDRRDLQWADFSRPAVETALALDPTLILSRAGMTADLWQADLLMDASSWWLLLCGRQVGKTTGCAALALHTAITEPGSLTLILSPSIRQGTEILRRVADLYIGLYGSALPNDAITALRIELGNKSRIVVLPGSDDKTVRVFSGVRLIVVDEGARVPDELFYAVVPMLVTSGGRMVIASTPWFARGYMHREWRDGGDVWRRVKIKTADCPRAARAVLERERKSKPAAWFRQEYEAEWGSTADALFPADMIDRCLRRDVEPYRPERARFL